jgi:hypothetical protein
MTADTHEEAPRSAQDDAAEAAGMEDRLEELDAHIGDARKKAQTNDAQADLDASEPLDDVAPSAEEVATDEEG